METKSLVKPAPRSSRWVRIPRPLPSARRRLVCFPHAGAGASIYYPWIRLLESASIELCAIQYPGREDRIDEAFVSTWPRVVETLAAEWDQIAGSKPCALFGHSMGAAIACDVAAELAGKGGRNLPVRLFISGRNPPHLRPDLPSVHDLPDQEFIARLINERGAKLPKEILENEEMLKVVTRVLRSDYALNESFAWRGGTTLAMPFSVFGGWDDPWTKPESLDEWRRYTTGSCRVRMIKGDHFFHQSSPHLVVAEIARDLEMSA